MPIEETTSSIKMERRGRVFTHEQLETVRSRVEKWKDTDEMALLVFLLLETQLKVTDLLGWFNMDSEKRKEYLKDKPELLGEYLTAPVLFPKTHQAYLKQWKRVCNQWFGIREGTFEMVRRGNGHQKVSTP
ncbi:hypothetical protein AVEN_261786-1 [Araneus ventricosus]|uniref:Uncharacterized protein n=1 Tax=Araneus ventricosus TaxID=182803 RepID=A0A4Y2LZY1_ARAVE|nr:hypothetical protein AVEN_261786-1 [Araneus ventricosus]